MTKFSDRRKGFALAVALAAIVIIGGLITGVYFASTQEYRIGRNTAFQARALSTAEYGLLDVAGPRWSTDWNTMSVGSVVTVTDTVSKPPQGLVANVRVTALGNGTFLISSSGTVGPSAAAQARRRVGALLALRRITLNMQGALMTRGSLKIGGSSKIDGNDSPIGLQGWNCPPAGDALAGIAINDTTKIDKSGCSNLSCVSGEPKIKTSSAAGDTSTYTNFGDLNWQELKAMATINYAAGEATSPGPAPMPVLKGIAPNLTCNTDQLLAKNNWGDPKNNGPCKDYFPIIYSAGDMKLTGGMGQGILLVEGNLDVQGGFEFYGPVIVRKSLNTQGTGGHFNGGVMAANVNLDQNVVLGNAVVSYSRCALDKALNKSSRPGMATGRSWVELY